MSENIITKTYMTKKQMDNLEIDTLEEGRKSRILALHDGLDMSDESILNFGSKATQNLSEFSGAMLRTIKLKDFPEIDSIIMDLMDELKKVDSETLLSYKPSFLERLFGGDGLDKFLKNFTNQFDNASDVIQEIKKKLEDAKFQLNKDMTMCTQFLDQNLVYINDLDDCLFAAKMKLQEVQEEIDEEKRTLDKEDTLAVDDINGKQEKINRLERNIQDLYLIRESAIQDRYRLRIIKEGDAALIEKIKTSVNMAIPLWQSQMLVAFVVARQQNCADLEKAVSDTTNNLISMNAELVKTGAIKIAKELQRGIIDVDVLKTSSQKLAETFTEVRKINLEGKQKRLQAIEELGHNDMNLNKATLLEDNRR